MQKLFSNSRFWILTGSIFIAFAIAFNFGLFGSEPLYNSAVRTYAFWGVGMLYITLLISPLIAVFPTIPWKAQLIHARRATGVSVLVFGCTHAYFAFFKQLGGFHGLLYLDQHYLVAISVAAIANTIFVFLALTSLDAMVRKLGKYWKRLHKCVYVASFLILFHALSIGSTFVDLHTAPARLMLLAVFFLLILQALRVDRIQRPQGTKLGFFTLAVLVISTFSLVAFAATPAQTGLSIHSQHGSATPVVATLTTKVDTSKRYTLSTVTAPLLPAPGEETTLTMTVYDAATGTQIRQFTQLYEQFMHIIIVDSSLQHFAHIHPKTTAEGTFVATYTFPTSDRYHVYFNFVPFQSPEQQIGVSIPVGAESGAVPSELSSTSSKTAEVSGYTVTMSGSSNLRSADLSAGLQSLSFHISHGADAVALHPYVGAFGHLTLVNTSTYEFVHAHPKDLTVPKPTDIAAPDLSFYPMAIYTAIKPGTYRVYAEFSPDGNNIMAPFTITIQ
jgi:DMSO/TMAO reductase YedYZ heme-binding membrane subunit